MAKAGSEPIPTWISLLGARDLAAQRFLSIRYAERWILDRLGDADDPVRWRARAVNPPDTPIDGFWQGGKISTDWVDNSATKTVVAKVPGGMFDQITVYGIEVVREDVLALLPAKAGEPEGRTAAGTWIAAEVGRMKKAGEIPADIGISNFARTLATRMCDAAKKDSSLRPVKWTHIKNQLPFWGLWPVSAIK